MSEEWNTAAAFRPNSGRFGWMVAPVALVISDSETHWSGEMARRNLPGNTRHQGVDAETATLAARRIALALLHGNVVEAHSIIDTALESRNPARTQRDKLRLPVSQIGLELRISNMLERRGIRTVEQLLCTTRDELLRIGNIGPSALAKIICAVRDLGFAAEEDTTDESA